MTFTSSRTALSWNQQYLETVSDLRIGMKDINGVNPSNTDIFLLCMAIGFDNQVKGELPAKKSDSVRLSYLKDDHEAFIRALALNDAKDSSVLLDDEMVLDIAERFASGGLMLLAQELEGVKDFRTFLTVKLYKAAKTLRGAL